MAEARATVAVVCHDAGAANLVFAWLQQQTGLAVRAYAEGPAAQLWQKAFPGVALAASCEAALAGASLLISGTGWAATLEHDARVLARQRGLRAVAVLDHWVNYAARFVRGGVQALPDELWVCDDYALAEARRCFPALPVTLQVNHYLAAQLAEISPAATASPLEVLYLLEPARSDWGRGVAGEFQALDYFVQHGTRAGVPANAVLRLRPHPSDPPGKYADWVARHPGAAISIDTTSSLSAAISRATWVAGCETAALVVALQAGRRVLCTLPPWAPACRLPHAGIVQLRALAAETAA